jgi:hypothetical protein
MNIFTGNLPQGFRYIPQDNYLLCNPETAGLDYLYADSATSCIIIIVTGKDINNNILVGISHLSCAVRFNAFFRIIEKNFKNNYSVYAAGANPPEPVQKQGNYSYEAIKNVRTFTKWVAGNAEIKQCTALLGSGIPNNGFGAYGIGVNPVHADYLKVTDKYFHLPDNQIRDPGDGANILFCKLGLLTNIPSLVLRDMNIPLTAEEKTALVNEAKKQDWLNILKLTDTEILDRYSTTPEFEPSWFAENIKRSAEFVRDYKA